MKNTGTLVTAAIRPNDTRDKIASAYAVEIKGGLHHYATLAERNDIISERRSWGMLCTVYDDVTTTNNSTYILKYGHSSTTITDNSNWVKFSGSGAGSGGSAYWIDPVISIESAEPAASEGDRYIIGPAPTGTNWGVGSLVADSVVQWDSSTNVWRLTTPLDGMSVRVNNLDNSVFKYDSTSTSWIREKGNQVFSMTATSSNAVAYTAVDERFFSYETDTLYVVQFATSNSGATVSLNINGLGAKTVKQQTNFGAVGFTGKDISPDVKYGLFYDGTNFRLNKPTSDPTFVRYRIQSFETVVVPAYQEYLIYGDLDVYGSLNIDPLGKVVVLNGSLNIQAGATVSNSGNVQLITLATTTSATSVKKYSETITIPAGVPTTIFHNLNTSVVSVSIWESGVQVLTTVEITSSNDITVESISTITNALVVVMG